ncbi:MAG: FHA domain-containing protein [Dehalococcoidia bacterium]|nr:FHA domain-containing protein [Dehalococcoidia bacterium]
MEPFARVYIKRTGAQAEEYELSAASVTIGRAATNDIIVDDPKISRVHARFEASHSSFTVVDLGSANGVRKDGQKVDKATLRPGESVLLGDTEVRFESGGIPDQEALSATIIGTPMDDMGTTIENTVVPMALSDTKTPRLIVNSPDGTREVPIRGDAIHVGRSPENDIVIASPAASRHHARVERAARNFILRDLGSSNGTWVGLERVEERTLKDGDTFRIGDTRVVFRAPFESNDLTMIEAPRKTGRKPVVVIPGLLGSELWRGNVMMWPNLKNMVSQPAEYLLPERLPMEARKIVEQVVVIPNLFNLDQYGRLRLFLEETLGYSRGKDLFEFPYDWRQDLRSTAKLLAEKIDGLGLNEPVTIVAHSMGSLVSRYYVEFLGGNRKVDRLIMLGGPHRGSPKSLATLLSGRGLIPFGIMGDQVRDAFRTYPAAYHLLPSYPAVFDSQTGAEINIYEDFGWTGSQGRKLASDSAGFLKELGMRCSVPAICIFGYGLKTATKMNVTRGPDGRWQRVSLVEEASGDTAVPEASAILPGAEIHPVRQYHGALYTDNDVKMRLKLELTGAR